MLCKFETIKKQSVTKIFLAISRHSRTRLKQSNIILPQREHECNRLMCSSLICSERKMSRKVGQNIMFFPLIKHFYFPNYHFIFTYEFHSSVDHYQNQFAENRNDTTTTDNNNKRKKKYCEHSLSLLNKMKMNMASVKLLCYAFKVILRQLKLTTPR